MRILYVLMFFLMMSVTIHAQFINNGATVTIQSGATLRIETDFINNSGTVTNNGVLEVQEDFTNAAAATFTSATGSTVKFIGTTPSTVTSNGDAFHHVSMEKTAENITLADAMSVAGTLTFTNDNNKVILGANNLTIQDGGSIASADDNEYVVADGAGSLIKGLSANGTITHEIGDAGNYSPLSSVVTGSAYASATLGARVVDAIHPNKPTEADSYLSRYWVVNANGITGYANTITGTYASAGDIVGTASRVKGASFAPSTWTYTNAATNGTSTVTGSTTVSAVDFTGMNALNKVDLTVYLSGPLSGSTMDNYLQVFDPPATPTLLPVTSPYGSPTTTYADIANPAGPAGIVTDWIKVEVRDATDPSIVLETKSLILKNNGHIVDPLGGVPTFKDQSSNVRYAVHHRNHIAVLSNSSTGTFEGQNLAYDFSTAQTQAVKLDSGDPNQLQLKNGLYCMIPGDVNSDYSIDAIDLTSVKIQFNLGTSEVYHVTDLNLDGGLDAIDLTLQKISFNNGYFSTLGNL